MPIPESILTKWSHHRTDAASIQAHESIRAGLAHTTGFKRRIMRFFSRAPIRTTRICAGTVTWTLWLS